MPCCAGAAATRQYHVMSDDITDATDSDVHDSELLKGRGRDKYSNNSEVSFQEKKGVLTHWRKGGEKKKIKTTAPRIPAWSPTVVLTERHFG